MVIKYNGGLIHHCKLSEITGGQGGDIPVSFNLQPNMRVDGEKLIYDYLNQCVLCYSH